MDLRTFISKVTGKEHSGTGLVTIQDVTGNCAILMDILFQRETKMLWPWMENSLLLRGNC
jgi:hypothetical protein